MSETLVGTPDPEPERWPNVTIRQVGPTVHGPWFPWPPGLVNDWSDRWAEVARKWADRRPGEWIDYSEAWSSVSLTITPGTTFGTWFGQVGATS